MNDYTAVPASPCPICVAAFVRALYPEATMFSIDPEDDDVAVRRRLLRLRNMNDYVPDVDYFLYDMKTSTSTTSTPERLLPLLRLRRLLPLRPGDLILSGVEPEDPLFPHVCTLNPNPNTYALFSITSQLFL